MSLLHACKTGSASTSNGDAHGPGLRPVTRTELGDGPYLFGDWFTAADIMIGSMFIWKRIFGGPPDRPKLEAYVDRLMARPRAMKIGG